MFFNFEELHQKKSRVFLEFDPKTFIMEFQKNLGFLKIFYHSKKNIGFSKIPKIFGAIDEFLRILEFWKTQCFFWIYVFLDSDPKT